jgi:hypothetical protein
MLLRCTAEADSLPWVIRHHIMTVHSTNLAAVAAEIRSNNDGSHDHVDDHHSIDQRQAFVALSAVKLRRV